MSKFKSIALVIVGIVFCYVVLAVFVGFLAEQTVIVNQALDDAHNMSQYPGTSGFLLSVPWIMYMVPAVIGIVWVVLILKGKGG